MLPKPGFVKKLSDIKQSIDSSRKLKEEMRQKNVEARLKEQKERLRIAKLEDESQRLKDEENALRFKNSKVGRLLSTVKTLAEEEKPKKKTRTKKPRKG